MFHQKTKPPTETLVLTFPSSLPPKTALKMIEVPDGKQLVVKGVVGPFKIYGMVGEFHLPWAQYLCPITVEPDGLPNKGYPDFIDNVPTPTPGTYKIVYMFV